jgi:hypothetical protein
MAAYCHLAGDGDRGSGTAGKRMDGRWREAAAPVLVGLVAGLLVGFMGAGPGTPGPATPKAPVTTTAVVRPLPPGQQRK